MLLILCYYVLSVIISLVVITSVTIYESYINPFYNNEGIEEDDCRQLIYMSLIPVCNLVISAVSIIFALAITLYDIRNIASKILELFWTFTKLSKALQFIINKLIRRV